MKVYIALLVLTCAVAAMASGYYPSYLEPVDNKLEKELLQHEFVRNGHRGGYAYGHGHGLGYGQGHGYHGNAHPGYAGQGHAGHGHAGHGHAGHGHAGHGYAGQAHY